MLSSGGHQAADPHPGVVSNGVLPDALVVRSLPASVHQQLVAALDRQHGRVTESQHGAVFMWKLIEDNLGCSVDGVPELHALVRPADDGSLDASSLVLHEGARAPNSFTVQGDVHLGVVVVPPVVDDDAVLVDRPAEECGLIFVDLT